MNKNQATAGLRNLFHTIADGVIHQFHDPEKARFVADIPDGFGNQLVVEGSPWRNGHWQVYVQTPVSTGRIIQDVCEAKNDNVLIAMDTYMARRVNETSQRAQEDVKAVYVEQIRTPMEQKLQRTLG